VPDCRTPQEYFPDSAPGLDLNLSSRQIKLNWFQLEPVSDTLCGCIDGIRPDSRVTHFVERDSAVGAYQPPIGTRSLEDAISTPILARLRGAHTA
jgi:hypothetical protein